MPSYAAAVRSTCIPTSYTTESNLRARSGRSSSALSSVGLVSSDAIADSVRVAVEPWRRRCFCVAGLERHPPSPLFVSTLIRALLRAPTAHRVPCFRVRPLRSPLLAQERFCVHNHPSRRRPCGELFGSGGSSIVEVTVSACGRRHWCARDCAF